jgi:hypothetical protein
MLYWRGFALLRTTPPGSMWLGVEATIRQLYREQIPPNDLSIRAGPFDPLISVQMSLGFEGLKRVKGCPLSAPR